MCACVCCHPISLDARFVDVPAGVTQEESDTGSLYLLSAVLALIVIAIKIQRSLSLVDREVEFCVRRDELIILHLLGNTLLILLRA